MPLLELLQVAVGRRDALSQAPSAAEWEWLFDMAKRQGLQGVLWDAVCRLPEGQRDDLPVAVARAWEGRALSIEILNDVHRGRCREVVAWMEGKGARWCILKGLDYARMYPRPSLRLSGDIDIWIPGDRAEAIGLFDGRCRVHEVLWQECKADFWPCEALDVHFWPSKMFNPVLRRRLRKFCSGQEDFEMCVDGFRVPSRQFSMVYCLLHLFRHAIEGGVGMRQFLDSYYIMNGCGGDERLYAYDWCCRLGMRKFVADVMWVMQEAFGMDEGKMLCSPCRRGGEKLMEEIVRGGNFGRFASGKKKETSSRLLRALRRTLKTLAFALRYPREALWAPGYKVWHYSWRMVHGFLK